MPLILIVAMKNLHMRSDKTLNLASFFTLRVIKNLLRDLGLAVSHESFEWFAHRITKRSATLVESCDPLLGGILFKGRSTGMKLSVSAIE
jgi:hypothetical protein